MKRLIVVAAVLAVLGGCFYAGAAVVGAGAYVAHEYFEGGWAKADFKGDFKSVWAATLKACDTLGYARPADVKPTTLAEGRFVAKRGSTDVDFIVASKTEALTHVEIKVDVLGADSEEEGKAIFKEISANLEKAAPK